MSRPNIAHLEVVPTAPEGTEAKDVSAFATVKIQCGMAGSTFLFDTDDDAKTFFHAACNIHKMGTSGNYKVALFLKGHHVMTEWDF